MNKEEIEEAKEHYIFTTKHILDDSNKRLKEYIKYLEQKESILDKVTEECVKQMTTYEDSILEIFPQRILNIIEGGIKND